MRAAIDAYRCYIPIPRGGGLKSLLGLPWPRTCMSKQAGEMQSCAESACAARDNVRATVKRTCSFDIASRRMCSQGTGGPLESQH